MAGYQERHIRQTIVEHLDEVSCGGLVRAAL